MIESDDYASVIVPVQITAAMVVSITSNGVALPEDSTAPWSAGTTYAIGQRAHSVATHRVYESLKDGNTNHNPTDPTNQTTATGIGTWWIDIGPTNKWAMFDGLISSQTVANSPMVIKLRPGAFDSFAIFKLQAASIHTTVDDAPGGNRIYDYDSNLEGSAPGDYYEYWFEGFAPRREYITTGVEPYGLSELTLTISAGTGQVKLGMLALGMEKVLGAPERNARVAPKGYDYIAEDAYGNTVIKRRASAMGVSIPIKVALEDADEVLQTVQDLLGTPVAVIGSRDVFHAKMSTFGLISGDMDYGTWPDRTLNLTVKGFI